jgi:hypothetical protein
LSVLVWGEKRPVQIRKVIQRRIRRGSNGVDFVGDVNAAVAGNVGESGQTTHVSSRSSVSAQSVRPEKDERGDDAEAQRRTER